jgi:predicted HicB family RNase H-like nuclease
MPMRQSELRRTDGDAIAVAQLRADDPKPGMAAEQRRHSASMRVRLQPEHDELIRRAADHAGISLSDWLRMVLLKAAREELGKGSGKSGKDGP